MKMRKYLFLLFFFICSTLSAGDTIRMTLNGHCQSRTAEPVESFKDSVINAAILDFTANCDLFKLENPFIKGQPSFEVEYHDEVYVPKLVQIDTIKPTYKWVKDTLVEDVVAVSIYPTCFTIYYSDEDVSQLPTRYTINDGALFYWDRYWDGYKFKNGKFEIISVLKKYNLLQSHNPFPFFFLDGVEGANYYFVKSDLSKFKIVITQDAFMYIQPPFITWDD